MPRKPRIDHVGLVHHVIFRGIERRAIFRDLDDHKEFLRRLESVRDDAEIFAWVLMPNHCHFLIRSGRQGLSRLMSRLLTGYAVYFNHRHKRVGHLFQNRYKSIVCDEDVYLKTLVAYIHLNPLKAHLVEDFGSLERYPWCGHGSILGKFSAPWHAVENVLAYFGNSREQAMKSYMDHLKNEWASPSRHNHEGGGLTRSLGGIQNTLMAHRAGERAAYDERILGMGSFVTSVLGPKESIPTEEWESLKSRIMGHFGVNISDLMSPQRLERLIRAREALIFAGVRNGKTGQQLATELKKSPGAISQAYSRSLKWIKGDEPWLSANLCNLT